MKIYLRLSVASFLIGLLVLVPSSVNAALTVGSTSLTSDGAIAVNGVANTADSVYLHANGGTSETIRLHSDQGTGVDSINLLSDAGGVTLQSNLATADGINLTATSGGLDLDAGLGITIDSTTFLSFDVTSATSASNITVAVDADAEDLTISTTGSAGDIFITSADDLTLTGSPVALISTGNITANASISLTNGAIVYNDTGTFVDCDNAPGTASVNLDSGNYFIVQGDSNGNCTLTISGTNVSATGGIYILSLNWQGAFNFILADPIGNRTIKQICEASGGTPDDNGDLAYLTIRMFANNTPQILSCAVAETAD